MRTNYVADRIPRNTPHSWLAALLGITLLVLTGCTVGPQYVKPSAQVPAAFKEVGPDWKQAQPNDQVVRGKWWQIFNDPQLNGLEDKIDVSNQNLKIAQDQYLQARAAVRISRSAYYPVVTGGASVSPTQLSSNRSVSSSLSKTRFTDYVLPVDASYEADVWGRVRRTVEASRSEAQASAADLEGVNLSLHSELAVDYFELRGLDAQEELLDSTVKAYEDALKLAQDRYNGGLASGLDVSQAQSQLETTRALALDIGVQRAQFEHAIAVLVGEPPSTFSLPAFPLNSIPPVTPPGLPSDLLERRPDIAAAERRMQAANAQIGIAKAAYYPLISLTAAGGFESVSPGTWISGPSGLWSLGASAVMTLFDAGRRHAVSDQAKAFYDQSVASYREIMLTSFQDVEDNLAALRILQDESKTEADAVTAAERTLTLSTSLYKGGLTTYLQVITAQSAALVNERTAVDISTRRMISSVLLIKAIGGGWDRSSLPARPECCGRLVSSSSGSDAQTASPSTPKTP
jgi:NodT family efflux transporter outer membrane factor (OMF) lipoprotein